MGQLSNQLYIVVKHMEEAQGIYALGIVLFCALLSVSYASSGLGTSKITFNQSSLSIGRNATAYLQYNLSIASGNSWGTYMNIVNKAALESDGISLNLSENFSTFPPFSGVLTIKTASDARPGNYTAIFNGTGDDPTTSNAEIRIMVTNTTSSSSPSAPSLPKTSQKGAGPLDTVFLVVIFIAFIALLGYKSYRFL